jgi:nucleotide-binding universal stress UspA family protein
MGMFNTIVVAVDFSEMSRDVLHYAVQLAGSVPGASLHVLHVVPDPLQQPWTVEAAGIDFARLEQEWVAEANRRVHQLITAEGIEASSAKAVVQVGRAADTIVRYGTDISADVIVMGTHGYGPIKRFMLGSVAERVLRQAPCPVVTIPHSGLKATEPQAVAAGEARR